MSGNDKDITDAITEFTIRHSKGKSKSGRGLQFQKQVHAFYQSRERETLVKFHIRTRKIQAVASVQIRYLKGRSYLLFLSFVHDGTLSLREMIAGLRDFKKTFDEVGIYHVKKTRWV